MITIFSWVKRITFLGVSMVVGFEVYDRLVRALLHGSYSRLLPFLVLWALTAYVVLPRIHRVLTRIYVPDYFIGRVRLPDGILGDPVNLAVNGTKAQLVQAMKRQGWHEADVINLKSSWRMAFSSVLGRSYPTAPMSSLFLFGRQQDLAFQKDVNDNPRARHHVRFWKTPAGWWLPGGYKVKWLGAATYDRRVGFSLFTGQITHKIAENTDHERDFVADSLKQVGSLHKVKHFSTAYHSRNGGGDSIKTDGSLVIVELDGLVSR